MGLKAQLGWLRSGASRTNAALEGHGAQLADLQRRVDELSAIVARLDSGAVQRIDALMDDVRVQLRTVTDDLGDRVGAVSERLDSLR